MRVLLLAVLALGGVSGAQRSPGAYETVPLSPSSQRVLDMPGFQFWGPAQCDSDGNLYFHAGRDPNALTTLKILTDGSHAVYGIVGQDAAGLYFVASRVAPDRKLYVLAGGAKDELYLLKFGDDPTHPDRTQLESPSDIRPSSVHNFLITQDGEVLLQGYFTEDAPHGEQGRGYVAEFSGSGDPMRKSFEKTSEATRNYVAKHAANYAAASGADGLFYLLEPDRVLVLSQTGRVVRSLKLHVPDERYHAMRLYMSGHRLAITLDGRRLASR